MSTDNLVSSSHLPRKVGLFLEEPPHILVVEKKSDERAENGLPIQQRNLMKQLKMVCFFSRIGM